MDPKFLLLFLQEPATVSYPEPAWSTPQRNIRIIKIYFNNILSSKLTSSASSKWQAPPDFPTWTL